VGNVRSEQLTRAGDASPGIIDIDASRQRCGVQLAIDSRDNSVDIMPMLTGDQFGRKQSDQIKKCQHRDVFFRRIDHGKPQASLLRLARTYPVQGRSRIMFFNALEISKVSSFLQRSDKIQFSHIFALKV
jgi:hypothetical protein